MDQPRLRRARMAVAGLFVVNAAAYANIVPRLPGLKAELGLSNAALGSAVAAVPAGALLSGLAAGALINRWGTARVATGCGAAFALVVPAVSLADSWAALAALFLVFGLVDSVMDVAMNAHALRVQRAYGRSIVSGFHGLWSLGAVAGAGAASVAVGLEVGVGPHLVVAGLALAAVTAIARNRLLTGLDDAGRGDLSRGSDSSVTGAGSSGAREPSEAAALAAGAQKDPDALDSEPPQRQHAAPGTLRRCSF